MQNSLTTARKQLPKEHCGIVIVSTPQRWFHDKEFKSIMEETAEWYWTQTKRVALLAFYSNDFVPLGEHFHLRAIAFREFTNPNSRYAEKVGLGLFKTALIGSRRWVDFIQVVRRVREQPKPE